MEEEKIEETTEDVVEEPTEAPEEDTQDDIEDKDQFLTRLRKEKEKRAAVEARLAALEEEKKLAEERASLADEAAEALAAQRNITVSEARALLREESRNMLKKHAPKVEQTREQSELFEIRLELQKRDLLDEVPEARSVISQVMQVAKATGKSLKDVYDRQFRSIAEQLKGVEKQQNKSMQPRQSFRESDEDITDDNQTSRAYKKHMEAAINNRKNPLEARKHISNALKEKLFGRGSR